MVNNYSNPVVFYHEMVEVSSLTFPLALNYQMMIRRLGDLWKRANTCPQRQLKSEDVESLQELTTSASQSKLEIGNAIAS